ncbi:MAG TPA: hypothetical protein VG432_06935 [Gemmatimonadaceae bacterium]|nr:hypothetical protein [Gemmatimonadaceae bacterium]
MTGTSMRPRLVLALALAAASGTPARALAAAQDAGVLATRAAVEMVSYTLKADSSEKTISQLVTPIAVAVPIGERFSFDLATAYAHSRVEMKGAAARPSTIYGLTDTQLRGSYVFGQDAVVLTAGVSLPTGQSTANARQFAAAQNISNDFLLFPIGTMGAGFGATGGIAMARSIGAWNVGLGGSYRHSADFAPFEYNDGQKAHYQPGNELRARIGVDRSFGASSAMLGATYSSFGDDKSAGATFNTGNRLVFQGAYATMVRRVGYALNAWNLTRTHGTRADGRPAPFENITNVRLSGSYAAGGVTLEPMLEARHLARGAVAAGTPAAAEPRGSGQMETAGVRARWKVGGFQVAPGAAFSTGKLLTEDLTGWHATVAIRFVP